MFSFDAQFWVRTSDISTDRVEHPCEDIQISTTSLCVKLWLRLVGRLQEKRAAFYNLIKNNTQFVNNDGFIYWSVAKSTGIDWKIILMNFTHLKNAFVQIRYWHV